MATAVIITVSVPGGRETTVIDVLKTAARLVSDVAQQYGFDSQIEVNPELDEPKYNRGGILPCGVS